MQQRWRRQRVVIRRARVADVPAVAALMAPDVGNGRLLAKPLVTLYEDVPDFWVAVQGTAVVGCGALHVIWSDLAEVRTLVVAPTHRGTGVGGALLTRLVEAARDLGVHRLFCLTFETAFFGRHGFEPIAGVPVSLAVYAELLLSYDEGVAEFLDLARVKPNTLGNSRMLLDLAPSRPQRAAGDAGARATRGRRSWLRRQDVPARQPRRVRRERSR